MSVQNASDAATEHAEFDSEEQAQDTIEATLSTLGESITSGEAHDLATRLTDAFGYALLEREDPVQGPLDLDESHDRVADRADLEAGEVRTKVWAAKATLPAEYDSLFAPA